MAIQNHNSPPRASELVDRSPPEPQVENPKESIGATKLPLHFVSPIVKAYISLAHFLGNLKYGAWNWRASRVTASTYKAALERHMDAWWEGEEFDPKDKTPHLANALACICILIEASELGKLNDDRPPSSNYRDVSDRMAALMPYLIEQYGHVNPRHYTINDTDSIK